MKIWFNNFWSIFAGSRYEHDEEDVMEMSEFQNEYEEEEDEDQHLVAKSNKSEQVYN